MLLLYIGIFLVLAGGAIEVADQELSKLTDRKSNNFRRSATSIYCSLFLAGLMMSVAAVAYSMADLTFNSSRSNTGVFANALPSLFVVAAVTVLLLLLAKKEIRKTALN